MRSLPVRRLVMTVLRAQRGQVLILAAFSTVMVLGFTALATDVGLYLRDLRDTQNDADAAALAGAYAFMLKLPADEASATATQLAEEWATNNGAGGQIVWTGDGNCATTPNGVGIPWGVSDSNQDGDLDTICLEIARSTPSVFARVLGIDSFPAKRRAAARAVHAGHGAVCPWALKSTDPGDTDPGDSDGDSYDDYLGVQMGKIYAIKVSESDWGNFGLLSLFGTGANDYKDGVAAGCASNGYNAVSEGETIETETKTGKIGNPTVQALETYLGYELTDGINDGEGFGWCDVPMNWDDVAQIGTPSGYDPNAPGGARQGCGTDALNGRSGRYMLIPIVDQFPPHGTSANITILAIANVYVTGWGQWDPAKGEYNRHGAPGHAELYAEFIEEAPFKPKDLVGVSDNPLAPLRIMLIR
jgi:hypothetical protein